MSDPWGNQPPFDPSSYPRQGGPDQPGYGYPPPPPGAYPGANMPYPPYPVGFPAGYQSEHPQAITSMVLGILGLVCCGLASPFAIWLGRKSTQEIDASGGRFGGRGQAQAGFILGIIGTALWVLAMLFYAALFVFGIAASNTQMS